MSLVQGWYRGRFFVPPHINGSYMWKRALHRVGTRNRPLYHPTHIYKKGVLGVETKRKQYIYVLKLIPTLLDERNWTAKEEDIVGRHFRKLQDLLAEGKLILAGKTDGLDERTFGIVIFEADSEEEARTIMNSDPAVAEGIMTAELFPYTVALLRGARGTRGAND